jgi:hypothetical protein
MYPDFIGIGAQKAGTTWLYRNLRTHPQIHMPHKEVHYFDRRIHDRSNALTRLFGGREADAQWRRRVKRDLTQMAKKRSLEDLAWIYRYYMTSYDDEWYASVFQPEEGEVAGEITPAYSALDRDGVAHVFGLMPEAKIVFFVRNPIERVWSNTVMSFDKVRKASVGFVPDDELFRKLERKGARKRTDYLGTLENWGAFYPEDRIFVGFLEDVRFRPAELLKRLYGFLGVDQSFEPPRPSKRVHTRSSGEMPRRVAVHLARAYLDEIKQLHERFGGYASFWYYCAERLIEDPPDTDAVPYPLWESAEWQEWVEGSEGASDRRPPVQSGPLSSLRVP